MTNWLFQGNPKRYPVLDHLLDGQTTTNWTMTQHIDDVSNPAPSSWASSVER